MKRIVGAACMLSCCLVGQAFAQWPLAPLAAPRPAERQPQHAPSMASASFGELQPTEAMWFHEQARKQYENPQAAVRANAEFRTAQRMQRMAAREFYGISPSRPTSILGPGYHPIMSPVAHGYVPRTTVIVVPDAKPIGWR